MESIFELVLPVIIHILEGMGIFIIIYGSLSAFYHYCRMHVFKREQNYPVKHQFATAMALGLEFKLAAEIIKTALVETLDELFILGAIFILRIAMTFVIEYEVRSDDKNSKNNPDETIPQEFPTTT